MYIQCIHIQLIALKIRSLLYNIYAYEYILLRGIWVEIVFETLESRIFYLV
jgi:hypothetical protein